MLGGVILVVLDGQDRTLALGEVGGGLERFRKLRHRYGRPHQSEGAAGVAHDAGADRETVADDRGRVEGIGVVLGEDEGRGNGGTIVVVLPEEQQRLALFTHEPLAGLRRELDPDNMLTR